jgi:hypothetical protein
VPDREDPDRDGDGVANAEDRCPNRAGSIPGGCPDPDPAAGAPAPPGAPPPDRDGDGVPDREDPDRDGDGVANAEDRCPNRAGTLPNGCPAPAPAPAPGAPAPTGAPPADRDGDGVPDRADPDRDGDGVANADDRCPNRPGTLPNGCPGKAPPVTTPAEPAPGGAG